LLEVFAGYVLEDRPPLSRSALAAVLPDFEPREGDDIPDDWTSLLVGTPSAECEISYRCGPEPNPLQDLLTVREPLISEWLWERIFWLMTDWDLFMEVPGFTRAILVETRPGVIPQQARVEGMTTFLAPSVDDLLAAVRQVDGPDE
jgi:hypothetical protein